MAAVNSTCISFVSISWIWPSQVIFAPTENCHLTYSLYFEVYMCFGWREICNKQFCPCIVIVVVVVFFSGDFCFAIWYRKVKRKDTPREIKKETFCMSRQVLKINTKNWETLFGTFVTSHPTKIPGIRFDTCTHSEWTRERERKLLCRGYFKLFTVILAESSLLFSGDKIQSRRTELIQPRPHTMNQWQFWSLLVADRVRVK